MKWSVFWELVKHAGATAITQCVWCWLTPHPSIHTIVLFLYIFQLNFRVLMRIWRKFLTTWAIIVAESSSESTHQHFKLHKMRSEINEFRLTPNHQLVIISLNLPAYHFTIHTIFNPLVVLAGALSNPLTIISVNFESLSNKKHFLISGRLNNH